MTTGFDLTAVAFGAGGALLHEATRWVALRTENKLPAYMYKIHYWLLTLVLVATGGALAGFMTPQTAMQALYIGISAPAIISRIGAAYPKQLDLGPEEKAADRRAPAPVDSSLQDWFRG
jgi:hypothetical protein